MTDEPKRKLMVGDHPVSPFGRTEAYADDEYWQEAAKRLQDERDTLTAALAAARERETMLTTALEDIQTEAIACLNSDRNAVRIDNGLSAIEEYAGAALFTTLPPTDPMRHPHDAMTAAEGDALTIDELEEAWREETRRFIRGEGGSIERVQAARARLPDGVLLSFPLATAVPGVREQAEHEVVEAARSLRATVVRNGRAPAWLPIADEVREMLTAFCETVDALDAIPTAPPTGTGETEGE